jgi:hypothetical protein
MSETAAPPEYDLLEEECLTFAQAARWLPAFRKTKKNSPSTIARWVFKGLLTDSQTHRVYLERVRIGGTNFTSKEALRRFFDKLNDGPTAKKVKRQRTAKAKVDEAMKVLRERRLLGQSKKPAGDRSGPKPR